MEKNTIEYYISLGFDADTAASLVQTSGNTATVEAFPKIAMSYSDILLDNLGVKKGNFISGYVEDKKLLSVKEEGTDFGNKIEFFILGIVYQVSHYDVNTNSVVFATPFYTSSFETKTQRDKKTGVTVEEYRNSGRRATFNQIMLLMVKSGDTYVPYLHYLHGTNYNKWKEQLENLGVTDTPLQYNFAVKSVKVATNFAPAWCFEITSAKQREPEEIAKSVSIVSPVIKKFNDWVKKNNATSTNNSTTIPSKSSISEDDDIDEDDINF